MAANQRLVQIDALKGMAILGVLALHAIPGIHQGIAVELHAAQAVSMFLILWGLNYGMSFKRRGYSQKGTMYPREYVIRQLKRLGLPFIIAFIAAAIVGGDKTRWNRYLLLGRLPIAGPGNYFVSLVIQLAIIFPILYRLYKKYPRLMVMGGFMVEAGWQWWTGNRPAPTMYYWIWGYFSAVVLGLWLSDDYEMRQRNWWLLGLAGVSLGLLIIAGPRVYLPAWPTQSVMSIFYPAGLIVLGIKYLPQVASGWLYKYLIKLGQASYQIFLVQIIYFGIDPLKGVALAGLKPVVDMLICSEVGKLFFRRLSWLKSD